MNAEPIPERPCDHKFVASKHCLRCGVAATELKAAGFNDALRLLAEQAAELEELRRRIANQAESLKCPRLEDVVEIQRLKGDLARTRFLSVLRGKLGETWARMLDKERAELARVKAELAEANNRWHSACDVGRRLERRNAELMADVDEAEAKIVDMSKRAEWLEGERAEAKRAAETWEELAHGQEVLGRQADAIVERFKALALDATAKMNAMEVSMNAAYTERNRLVALVARICKPTAGIRRTPIEGWNPEWTNCVFIDTSQGQMSWHYHDSDAHLFADLPAYEKPWDGHTTAEKYERLWRLTELTAAIP